LEEVTKVIRATKAISRIRVEIKAAARGIKEMTQIREEISQELGIIKIIKIINN
jgi:hypothetical protein